MDKHLSLWQKNPQAAGAILLGSIAILTVFLHIFIIGLILVVFASRRLLAAKKSHEESSLIRAGYIVTYISIFLCLAAVIRFVIIQLMVAGVIFK